LATAQQQQEESTSPGSLRAVAGGIGVPGSSSSGSSQGAAPRCSLGQQFLQDYLDSLGALNTFG
jgi:hypothetical protein